MECHIFDLPTGRWIVNIYVRIILNENTNQTRSIIYHRYTNETSRPSGAHSSYLTFNAGASFGQPDIQEVVGFPAVAPARDGFVSQEAMVFPQAHVQRSLIHGNPILQRTGRASK